VFTHECVEGGIRNRPSLESRVDGRGIIGEDRVGGFLFVLPPDLGDPRTRTPEDRSRDQ
jgi:hypothetical protein